MPFRILSFDGGGLRGVVSARVFANLCEDLGPVHEGIGLLAGSSVGSTNALALALGARPRDMVELYRRHCSTIFKPGIRRLGAFRPVHRTENQRLGLLGGLRDAGIANADTRTLGSLDANVLVTTFQLNGTVIPSTHRPPQWKAKLFHNFPCDNDGEPNPDLDHTVIDVILRSSAAPVLFGVYQGFADGGLVAINPSMCALAQAVNPATGGAKFSDVRMLSIGTGRGATLSLDVVNAKWGFVQWGLCAGRNADRFIDAFADVPDFQARQLLGENYLRLNPDIPPDASCDRPSDIPALIDAADAFRRTAEWDTSVKWIRDVWLQPTAVPSF